MGKRRTLEELVRDAVAVGAKTPLGRQRVFTVSPQEFAVLLVADDDEVQRLAVAELRARGITGWESLPPVQVAVVWP